MDFAKKLQNLINDDFILSFHRVLLINHYYLLDGHVSSSVDILFAISNNNYFNLFLHHNSTDYSYIFDYSEGSNIAKFFSDLKRDYTNLTTLNDDYSFYEFLFPIQYGLEDFKHCDINKPDFNYFINYIHEISKLCLDNPLFDRHLLRLKEYKFTNRYVNRDGESKEFTFNRFFYEFQFFLIDGEDYHLFTFKNSFNHLPLLKPNDFINKIVHEFNISKDVRDIDDGRYDVIFLNSEFAHLLLYSVNAFKYDLTDSDSNDLLRQLKLSSCFNLSFKNESLRYDIFANGVFQAYLYEQTSIANTPCLDLYLDVASISLADMLVEFTGFLVVDINDGDSYCYLHEDDNYVSCLARYYESGRFKYYVRFRAIFSLYELLKRVIQVANDAASYANSHFSKSLTVFSPSVFVEKLSLRNFGNFAFPDENDDV